ncbi:MAG: ABC transporter permease subunit, partial [Actinomycetota bacterium]|nr:ABC transporter permease subunit [Actinomycetota bacterium]
MTRLLATELKRLASRRLFRWILVLTVVGLVLIAALVFVNAGDTFNRSDMESGLLGLAFPLIMLGWLVGASSIGAEWTHRTVTALLTWEPRRTRVLVAKAVAACVYTLGLVVVVEAVYTVMMLPAAAGGGPGGGEPFAWSDYVASGARIAVVAIVAATLGFAIATVGRNTGAALGGGMAYLLIAETLIRAWKPSWESWLLGSNMGRFVEGGEGVGALTTRTTSSAAVVL